MTQSWGWLSPYQWDIQGGVQANANLPQMAAAMQAQADKQYNDVMMVHGALMQIEGGLYLGATGPLGAILGANQVFGGAATIWNQQQTDTPITIGASNWLQYAGGYNYADARSGGRMIDAGLMGLTMISGIVGQSTPWSAEPTIYQPGNGVYPQYLDNLSLQQSIETDFTNVNSSGIDLTTQLSVGTNLSRNWGGNSGPWGQSWTTDSIINQSRNSLGLETTNTGEFVSHGTLIDNTDVYTQLAQPWGRFSGGGQETIVPDAADQIFLNAVTMPDEPLPWSLPTDPTPLPTPPATGGP